MKTLKFKNKPYIIQNKGYSTIEISLLFPIDYNKEDLFNWALIKQIVLNSSYDYKLEKDFIKQTRNLTIIDIGMHFMYIGDKQFIIFAILVPDPKKLKDYNLNEVIKFFLRTIYKPNIINNEFNKEKFEREKDYLTKRYQNENDNHNVKSQNEFLDIFDNIGYLKENMFHNMHLIEKANPKELYTLYQEKILNNRPIVITYGDIDENITIPLSKYIDFNDDETTIKIKKDKYYKPFKKQKNINTKSTDKQSFLYLGYKTQNMKKEYEDYLITLRNILYTGSNSLVHNILRYDYQLLYYHHVKTFNKLGILYISLSLEKDQKDIAISAIDSIFKKLHNKEFLQECLNKLIKDMQAVIREEEDEKDYKLNKFINKKFKKNSNKSYLKKLTKLDLDKFIDFLDNLKNDTIFFKEGESCSND